MNNDFLSAWAEAATTTLGFFWMAFWAFGLGYVISSMIQVFVTEERMKQTMGEAGAKSVGLATVFGFVSSSCSFAALATTKSLFKKGAGLVPSFAFLLASTNLVIELGIVVAVFLSWHFVVGEYVGGLLLILFMWVFVKLTPTKKLEEGAREHLDDEEEEGEENAPDPFERMKSREGWAKVGHKYLMEWKMVWKDVTFGFTVAGVIAAFVPTAFFRTLFVGAGSGEELTFWQILEQTVVGPVAAFFTFIGSMGNIPLAALLYDEGVSFAGVMAFIFSDLVVFPVLRINAKYYGWKMALYMLATLLVALVASALALHYGFHLVGSLPEGAAKTGSVTGQDFFKVDYTLWLNLAFLGVSGLLAWLWHASDAEPEHGEMADKGWLEKLLFGLAVLSYAWLGGGLIAHLLVA